MSRTATITWSSTLNVHECPTCAIVYAIPADFDRRKQEDASRWYCPNGHIVVYTKSDADRLRDKLAAEEAARKRAEAREVHQRDQRQAAERSAAAYKGRVTRLKNRAAAGVCPCCNRSFENLRRHMNIKHPDFAESP
jgi:hypothetical protein